MLPTPDTKGWQNTVASPKQLLAYLKAGCEIKQVGQNRRFLNDGKPDPKYYLIAPNLQWEFEVEARHVQALETLELIEVDCCGGNYWISKQSFNIPAIKKIPQLSCKCGWQGDSENLKENGSLSHADKWYECPSCSGDVLSMQRQSQDAIGA